MSKSLIPLCLVLAGILGGCHVVRWMAYMLSPGGATRTVHAECDALAGSKVAVVVYPSYEVQSDYPSAGRDIAFALAKQLRDHVKGIELVHPDRVADYQRRHLDWEAEPKTELGKALSAEYVLFVSVIEFSTQEYADYNVFRGRLAGEARLYDVSRRESEALIWPGEKQGTGQFHVVFPPDRPVGSLSEDDRPIRYGTIRTFVQQLARKFYKHEVPKG